MPSPGDESEEASGTSPSTPDGTADDASGPDTFGPAHDDTDPGRFPPSGEGSAESDGSEGDQSRDVDWTDRPPRSDLASQRRPVAGAERPSSVRSWIRWFLTVREGWPVFVREMLSSVIAVLLVGVLLFAASGVWPPMVAVESGSMEPHMYRGDLVFIMEEHRFSPDIAHSRTGVVTYETGKPADYTRFGSYGDVIVFDSPSSNGPPIIHRARFWVDQGENWYERADSDYLNGDDCDTVPNCPAPNAGFITRGDANPTYDQVSGISRPVRPAWIAGTAEVRIPWLGYIRLEFSELSVTNDLPGIDPATLVNAAK